MCRSNPPFYEQEINGVCVKVEPNVGEQSPLLGSLSFILVFSVLGVVLYSLNKSLK
jgi:hypothetical protein